MKEAIGGSYLFILVIIMVALFTSYVSISTNYSRCYNIKDEIINSIESHGGVDHETLAEINTYLSNIGYRSTGTCTDADSKKFSISNSTSPVLSEAPNYCIKRHPIETRKVTTNGVTGHPKTGAYYTVTVFFKLSMPVIGELFFIPLSGETSILYVGVCTDSVWGHGACGGEG
jgi:hypothetical protein